MPNTFLRCLLVSAALASSLSACGSPEGSDAASAVTPTTSAPAPEVAETTAVPSPVTPAPAATTPVPEASAEAMVDFVMPNFRGANLQDAQNKVQELGLFFSISHDLRGSRNQVVDSNWQVCDQLPAVGRRIKGKAADYEGKIDFGVVKLSESCP